MCFSFLEYPLSLLIPRFDLYVNAESRRKRGRRPYMRQMEERSSGGRPEKLDHKPERSIGGHIQRVYPARLLSFPHLWDHQDQHYNVIEDFQLSCWEAQLRPRDAQARAASRNDAVDPGTHQCKDHADRQDVKNILLVPPCQPRAEVIGDRHEENAAEEAHVSYIAAFQKRKGFHAAYSDHRMQHGNDDDRIPFHPQPRPHFV